MKKFLTAVFSVGEFLSLFSVYGMQEERQNGERRWSSEIYDTSGDEFSGLQDDNSFSYYPTFSCYPIFLDDSDKSDDEFSELQDDNFSSYDLTFPEGSCSEHDYRPSDLESIKARFQSSLKKISSILNFASNQLDEINQRFKNEEINESECASQEYDLHKKTKKAVRKKIKEACEGFNELLSSSDGDKKRSLINAFHQYVDNIVKFGVSRLDVNAMCATSGVSFRHVGPSVLDLYCVFITSRYFDSIDDHVNLLMVSRAFQYNFEKFYYNPLPLTKETRELFPNLQTLYIYSKEDEKFDDDDRIKAIEVWYPYDYTEGIAKNTTYRNLRFTREFVINWFTGKREISINDWPKIDDKETKAALDDRCFSGCYNIHTIEFPTYITQFGERCFQCNGVSKIVLPKYLKEVGADCFSDCSELTEIKLPNTCTKIGSSCFKLCTSLTSVTLPENIRNLPSWVFAYCRSLKSIKIPSTVSSIDYACFYNCHSLDRIEIPQSVTNLKDFAFSTCTSLQNVILPDGLKKIGYGAFKKCCNLKQLTIPSTVTYIDSEAFKKCANLTIINKSNKQLQPELFVGVEAVENVGSVNLKGIEIEELIRIQNAKHAYTVLTDLKPIKKVKDDDDRSKARDDYVKAIESAQKECFLVEFTNKVHKHQKTTKEVKDADDRSIAIDGSCKGIECAQKECCLVKVHKHQKTTKEVKDDDDRSKAREGLLSCSCFNDEHILIKCRNWLLDMSYVQEKLAGKSEVVISDWSENNLKTVLGNSCFQSMQNLRSIWLLGNITELGDECFSYCTNLTCVVLAEGLGSLPKGAFKSCGALSSIRIPISVTSIGEDCFRHCSSLSSIRIPISVTSIGKYCFEFCGLLSSIEIPPGVTKIEQGTFGNCASLKDVKLPDNLITIEGYGFGGCTRLKDVKLPDNLITIEGYGFCVCYGLTRLTIPSSVQQLEDNAFCYCTNLTLINKSPTSLQASRLGAKAVENVGPTNLKGLDTKEFIRIQKAEDAIDNLSHLSSLLKPHMINKFEQLISAVVSNDPTKIDGNATSEINSARDSLSNLAQLSCFAKLADLPGFKGLNGLSALSVLSELKK